MRRIAFLVLPLCLFATDALGAESEADPLFHEGRDLMEKGRFAEAVAKLEQSEKLAPATGTLLNLGYCDEQLGRIRSAMEAYSEAEILASKEKDVKSSTFAKERLAAIEPKVMKLVLRVAEEGSGMQVTRNGVAVPKTDWNKPIPVDPDDYVIVARAPKRLAWRAVVAARGDGALVTIIVPPLAEVPVEKPPPPIRPRKIAAIGLGAAGFLSLGATIALGLAAKSRYGDSLERCNDRGCDAGAVETQHGAVTEGNIATALFALGAVCVGAGAYLFFAEAPAEKAKKTLRIDGNGIGAQFQ